MKSVLPVIIICSVGIAVCLAYIVYAVVTALKKRPPKPRKNKRNEFEIDDDTLIIKLGRKKK